MKKILMALMLACLGISMASAQDYPNRPIKLLVGFAPGGGTDILARLVGVELTKRLHQPTVVENMTGASGNLATQAAAAAKPDGYTLLLTPLTHNVNPILIPQVTRYDPIKDFTPITQLVSLPMVLVVAADSPIRTVRDLVEASKKSPGAISYASAGNGGSGHLTGALLASKAGLDAMHVPYKGNSAALLEVASGRVSFMFHPMLGIAPFITGKRVRAIAVTTSVRHADFPGVPTMVEAGFADFDKYSGPVGVVGPRGMPKDVVDKLNLNIRNMLADGTVGEQLRQLGAVVVGSTPAEYASFLIDDRARWSSLIRDANIKPD